MATKIQNHKYPHNINFTQRVEFSGDIDNKRKLITLFLTDADVISAIKEIFGLTGTIEYIRDLKTKVNESIIALSQKISNLEERILVLEKSNTNTD